MSERKKMYLIGNAHLDPAWLWTWQEGYSLVKSTFKSALDRLEEYEDFVFTASSASYYKWLEEDELEMFEKITQYVKEGRWKIVGGFWLQPDCNLLCGESFARHSLYSQRYFYEKFGKMCETGYNVDSFGHNANMPLILANSKMKNYWFMRPQNWEKPMDKDLFNWKSQDGSHVTTMRLPTTYPTNTLQELKEHLNDLKGIINKTGKPFPLSYGVGNHGGGPTIEMLDHLVNEIKNDTDPEFELVFSGPDEYFEYIRNSEQDIPTYSEEMQHHASGCYSAQSAQKKQNRISENKIINAEKYAVMAKYLTGMNYDSKRVFNAWENIMFNHFHDLLCGCSTKRVVDVSLDFYGESKMIADRLSNSSRQNISFRVDTLKGENPVKAVEILGEPLVIFNPLSWSVEVPVRYDSGLVHLGRYETQLTDFVAISSNNEITPVQKITCEHLIWDARDGIFMAKIPAYGYSLYYIKPVKEELPNNSLKCYKNDNKVFADTIEVEYGHYVMENENLHIEIDRFTGGISKYIDKKTNKNAISNHAAIAEVMEDQNYDTWAHGTFYFQDKIGQFTNAKVSIMEQGPVRCVVRAKTSYGNSEMIQDFILYAKAKDLRVDVKLEFREKHKSVKLAFPISIEKSIGYHEIPFGHVKRECNAIEEPSLNWFAISGESQEKPYAVAIMNDCKYSVSIDKNKMQLMAARNALYADHKGIRYEENEYDYLDYGVQTFSYKIKHYSDGLDVADITKSANELNTNFEYVKESYHDGNLPPQNAHLNIFCDNVIITSIKRAYDDDGYIVRAYELTGASTNCEMDIKLFNKKVSMQFKPYEVKTIKIKDDGNIKETDFIEMD